MSDKNTKRDDPSARTVAELIAELSKFPPTAKVMAYEAEDTGITVTEDNHYWFIRTPVWDDDD